MKCAANREPACHIKTREKKKKEEGGRERKIEGTVNWMGVSGEQLVLSRCFFFFCLWGGGLVWFALTVLDTWSLSGRVHGAEGKVRKKKSENIKVQKNTGINVQENQMGIRGEGANQAKETET